MSGGIVLDGDSDGSGSEVIRAEMDFAALSLLDVRKNVEKLLRLLKENLLLTAQ